jgi:hypothetical protein
MSTLVEYRVPLNSYVSSHTQPVPPEQRDPSRAGDCLPVMPSSRGWRKTSRSWPLNSGSASRNRTPWWASDPSPGIGTWPPPIKPTSKMVWWGARNGRAVTTAVRPGQAGDARDAGGLPRVRQTHRRQDRGEATRQPRRARPWPTPHQELRVRRPPSCFTWSLAFLTEAAAAELPPPPHHRHEEPHRGPWQWHCRSPPLSRG